MGKAGGADFGAGSSDMALLRFNLTIDTTAAGPQWLTLRYVWGSEEYPRTSALEGALISIAPASQWEGAHQTVALLSGEPLSTTSMAQGVRGFMDNSGANTHKTGLNGFTQVGVAARSRVGQHVCVWGGEGGAAPRGGIALPGCTLPIAEQMSERNRGACTAASRFLLLIQRTEVPPLFALPSSMLGLCRSSPQRASRYSRAAPTLWRLQWRTVMQMAC